MSGIPVVDAGALPAVKGVSAGSLRDYLELAKPRLTSLVALTALVGYQAGAAGRSDPAGLLCALAGTTLLAAGGCTLNQVMEHEFDGRMERTRGRPIPAGRLQPFESAVFGTALSAIGLLVLLAGTNTPTVLLGITATFTYLAVYTPLKRTTGLCTLFGAIPGALPPAMGWTAAAGQLEPGTCVLFGMLFLWQLPHFLAIAWMRRDDYARAGFAILTVFDPDGSATGRQAVLYTVSLLPLALVPALMGLAGHFYLVTALAMGLLYTSAAVRMAWLRTAESARGLFLTSLLYLPVVLTVLMIDRRTY
jgi:protoheme IX farnesyltransferase